MKSSFQTHSDADEVLDERPVSRHNGVTVRSVVIGLIGAATVAAFTPYNDFYRDNTFFVGNNFSIGVLFLIAFLVLGCNAFCKRYFEGAHLSMSELAIILSMSWATCVVPTSGLTRYWIPSLVTPSRLALNRESFEYVLPHIPKELMASMDPDSAVVDDFFGGNDDGIIPWDAWLPVLLKWALLIVPFFGMMTALSLLFRRQWVHNERLSFPLAQVMLSIIEEPAKGKAFNSFFHNRLAWIGIGVTMFFHLLYGLHAYYPDVPAFPLRYNTHGAFRHWPWWHMPWCFRGGQILIGVICITVLIPKNVAFSLWFFMVITNVARVHMIKHGVLYHREDRGVQQFGGYIVLAAALVYVSRHYLWNAVKNMLRLLNPSELREEDREPAIAMLFTVLFGGACLAWLIYWGMNPFWALVLLLATIVAHVILGRIVSEAGVMFVMTIWWPSTIILKFYHVSDLGTATAAVAVLATLVVTCDMRETYLPYAFNSLRVSHSSKHLRATHVAMLMMLAIMVGLVLSPLVSLKLHYKYSLAAMDNYSTYGAQRGFWCHYWNDVRFPRPHTYAWINFGVGAGLTAFLSAMHLRFAWWPFHPIGFVACHTYAAHTTMFSVFIGWSIKTLMMRYGGSSVYLKLRPLFIGGAIGEALVSGFWMFWAVYLFLAGGTPRVICVMPR